MAFVKLKKSILNSTVWLDRDVRDIWITALLMADLHELRAPTPTLKLASLQKDPFVVPAGWYGFVPAASIGIIRMAGMATKPGMKALQVLASPDPESRTPDHGGRRLVRVDGGFIVLTYDKHRQRDETAAERMRRYRDRRGGVTASQRVTDRNVTHLESDQDQELDPDQRGKPPLGRAGAGPRPGRANGHDRVASTDAKLAEMRAAADKVATPEQLEQLRRERAGGAA